MRGKERSAEMRDVLANAAEHRIQSAASQSVKAVVADTTANNTEDREVGVTGVTPQPRFDVVVQVLCIISKVIKSFKHINASSYGFECEITIKLSNKCHWILPNKEQDTDEC